jgi:DNA replicative helicase MCM subunit Mcm2 (Cdc46/Mcm family)
MTNHILQKSSGSLPSQLLTTQDFTQILSVATSIPVELHPSANDLLKGYYVTSRRVRGNEIPLTALNTMISLALSHARLNMRCTATVDDATLAILLYEESLVYKYGHSTLYVQPCQHFIDDNLTRYIGKELHSNMVQFHKQICQYVLQNHIHGMLREK